MAPSICHLPNGQNLTVTPVFGGVAFKANELANNRSTFPPGWTVVLNEEEDAEHEDAAVQQGQDENEPPVTQMKRHHIHRYKRPSLQNDHLFISTISSANTAEFKPPSSPTRQLAMMLWATLYWYFHQPEPDPRLHTKASEKTAEEGKPRGEWRINVRREGIFKGRNILAKLERMGLITSEDSSVGEDPENREGFGKMFITRRAFWQIDARTYLFTQAPVMNSPFPGGTPLASRPSSPSRQGGRDSPGISPSGANGSEEVPRGALTPITLGPFQSSSHLPTYYPPHPPHYVFTNGIRHPLRPKPFRQGETFYVRYIPSLGQYLSFRVASLSRKAPSQIGPWTHSQQQSTSGRAGPRQSISDSVIPTMSSLVGQSMENDIELLHKWMNDPRVAHSWGEQGPESHQEEFLRHNLSSRHSFPVIGCFDGKPFGYFEIYWVKEDKLGGYLGGEVGDYDRGIHCLVGEQEFRGPHRVKVWLSALVHCCFLADMRTSIVMLEPRVDNKK